jgi:hypothetical protein
MSLRAGKAVLALWAFALVAAMPIFSQVSVTSPSAKDKVKACPDYAVEILGDRMDMNERTDLGFRIFNGVNPYSVEQPPSYLSNITFAGGLFSARSVYTPNASNPNLSFANISILDSGYPGVSPEGNRFGTLYPIDADTFTVFAVRMYLQPDIEGGPQAQLYWSKNTIYKTDLTPNGGMTVSNSFTVYNNWAIYLVDIPALGIISNPNLRSDSWSGAIDSLRFDPILQKDKDIKIDWIRIVEKGAAYERTITWSGASAVDIYLDDDTNPANGNLGLLARSVSGAKYKFLAGALAPGTYHVAVAPAGTSNFFYASGCYDVTDQPILNFTKPSAEGSDQDFATAVLGDAWDMANAADVESTVQIENPQFKTLDYEDLSGKLYRGNTVYYGEAAPPDPNNVGDPHAYMLHFLFRGQAKPIDASKYHNLVLKMGVAGPSSPADGSVARVIWKNVNEDGENVPRAFIVRHFGDRWIMQKFVADLRSLALEPGDGSPSHSGWTGLIDNFRVDPHEFSDRRAFFIDDVRITADWEAKGSFPIEWTLDEHDGPCSVSLYYDINRSGFDGQPIVENLAFPAGASTGNLTWNTAGVPPGAYWIYAVLSDGLNTNRCYAGGPVIVRDASSAEIRLSRNVLYFGAAQAGVATRDQEVVVSNGGQGTLNWQAVIVRGFDWLNVIPTAGNGNAIIKLGIKNTYLAAGQYTGAVEIRDPGDSNSPQTVTAVLNVYETWADNPPFGTVDTPLDGTMGIEGAFPVTGWALDDIEVAGVKVWRDPVGNELVHPNGFVYLGDAVFIEGARPDVEQAYPEFPLVYRAGWGFQVLSNYLPGAGSGSYRLHAIAYDRNGNSRLLGSKTIGCDNAHATRPFGTIDTPAQGGAASGNAYVNFAWALTPQPKSIPADGSTILVWVDGEPLGHPSYNVYRSDIATLFPGYANSNGGLGYYYLDTTALSNGLHSIAWSVCDSAGTASGIGSRFFNVFNAGSGAVLGAAQENPGASAGLTSGFLLSPPLKTVAELEACPTDYFSPVFWQLGFDENAIPQLVFPGKNGVLKLEIPETGALSLWLDTEGAAEDAASGARNPATPAVRIPKKSSAAGETTSGYLVVGAELRPLPAGSTLDRALGKFSWQPGPGFIGSYNFIFIRSISGRPESKKFVAVAISPKNSLIR